MQYGYTKFWTMKSKLCWFSFYETEVWTESSYLKNQREKAKTKTRKGRKRLRNPSRQIPKWEILEKKKYPESFGEGNKCAQRRRGGGKEHNKQTKKNKAQNCLQSTETKSKYPSLTWSKEIKIKKKKSNKQTKRGVKQQSVLFKEHFCFYTANPKPSQSLTFPPIHKKTHGISRKFQ